jgi:hypothetical protein
MIEIFNLLFLLLFLLIFIFERYYFYKIFLQKIDYKTTRTLSNLPSDEYRPLDIPSSNIT